MFKICCMRSSLWGTKVRGFHGLPSPILHPHEHFFFFPRIEIVLIALFISLSPKSYLHKPVKFWFLLKIDPHELK
jgi:hypothetical protein